MSRLPVVALLFAASLLSAQQPQPTADNRSLAERAAALRKDKPADTSAGAFQPLAQGPNCDYKDAFFGLEVKCLDGWRGMSPTRLLALKNADQRIEFGMARPDGSNIIVSVEAALYRPQPADMKSALIEDSRSQVPNVELHDDPLTLSSPTHTFIALRTRTPGATTLQSQQLIGMNGSALGITITSMTDSEADLKDIIDQLRARLIWAAAAATPTPAATPGTIKAGTNHVL